MLFGKRPHHGPTLLLAIVLVAAGVAPACASDDIPANPGGRGGTAGDGGTGGGGTDGTGGTMSPTCGNGVVDSPLEDCDDANTDNSDGCKATCKWVCVDATGCSDGDYCNGDELCDAAKHVCEGKGPPRNGHERCGENRYCQNGQCVDAAVRCGDGFVFEGVEECDDGDDVSQDGCENDCKFTCRTDDECEARNPCLGGTRCDRRDTHTCILGTPLPDNSSCGTGLACRAGTCTSLACGNGRVDGTEECDDGNPQPGDGCENDCKFTCKADDPTRNCALGDTCAGTSSCDASTHRCTTATPRPDGSGCGGSNVCRGGVCINPTLCGNGTVDAAAGEDCDDQNTVQDDGCRTNCRFTCRSAADCNDLNICNGTEACVGVLNSQGKACQPGVLALKGTRCGDNKVCIAGSCMDSTCGDGVVDTRRSEECEPPGGAACTAECRSSQSCDLNGTWALKIVTKVRWPSTQVLVEGMGDLKTWAKITRTQTANNIVDAIIPCGVAVPAFDSILQETYGFDFPPSAFENQSALPKIDVSYTCSATGPGSYCQTPFGVVLLGADAARVPNVLTAELPENQALEPFLLDHDNDTFPAITGVVPAAGAKIPVAIIPADPPIVYRVDRVYIVLRQVNAFFATVSTCDAIRGEAVVSRADSRVVGCKLEPSSQGGRPCNEDERDFADFNKVSLVPGSSTFEQKKISGTSCADIRAALP
jgi:cysteine-rich repeat protein